MKINHYQEPTFQGFGDILNLLSFENYVIDEQVDILYHYDEVRTGFVNYIVHDFFKPKQNINRIFKPYRANNFKTDYRLINHDYWPSKINNKKIFDFAISLYYVEKLITSKQKRKYIEKKLFLEILNLLSDKKIVIINNQNDLNVTKKDVLNISKSNHFIGSDGGMTHIARSLKIPSTIFFRNGNSIYEEVVCPYIDNKIQNLCSSEQELILSIKELL